MRDDKFLKHDVTATDDERVLLLIEKEGMKGYGAYWMLLEALRKQDDLRLTFNVLRPLASRFRMRQEYLRRIIENYGLFTVENDGFYSAGMMKRLAKYITLTTKVSVNPNVNKVPKPLKIKDDSALHARKIKDKIREEQKIRVADAAELEGQVAVKDYRDWKTLVDEMSKCEDYMNQAGLHSGLGELYIANRDRIVELFKNQIELQGKQGDLTCLKQMKSYFSNFVSNGSVTNARLRAALFKEKEAKKAESEFRFEVFVAGQRTYFGHTIPSTAPPRPDSSAVWDDVHLRWVH